jgi:5-methylcytosine-specific restriction enzyme subunit McrC
MVTFDLFEWRSATRRAGPPSERDLRLANALGRDGAGVLDVEWLFDGSVRVTANSWVGVARFDAFEVHVVPKLAGGTSRVVEMIEYASGLDRLASVAHERDLRAGDRTLVDLVCLLLADECDVLVRGGLLQDYRETEATLSELRGQLRYLEQARRRFGQVERLECRFDEYDGDVVENKVLAAALAVACGICASTDVRPRLARLRSIFGEVCDPGEIEPVAALRDLVYHRRNAHYRNAHQWAGLVLRQQGIADLYNPGVPARRLLFVDMNDLFERFMTKLLTDAFRGEDVGVLPQRPDRLVIFDERRGRPYASIIPDVLLEFRTPTRIRVAIDAKYKLYDERKLDPGDVYQTFLYAYANGTADVPATAIIIYPASSEDRGVRLAVHDPRGGPPVRIRGLALNVPAALDGVRGIRRSSFLDELRAQIEALAGISDQGTFQRRSAST